MGRLTGKVAIITGGARGQGAAEAELFRDEGATVIITDVLDEDGGKTAAQLDVEFLHHDVSSVDDWETVVADVIAHHGRIDVLVNNAGILRGARLVNTSDEIWNETVAINQTGVFLGMRSVAPQMISQKSGSIVNLSSVAGLEATFASMAYGATKWAVRGMTKIAALELGRSNIRVNSIHPGLINTEMTSEFDKEKMVRGIPLGREAEASEVAALALFLASEEASYCTGQEFTVDGGMHR
ncbi:MAG TPA: 3-alpha-hydroxysteroid dehydrogenase [Acidimicrobiaceae bacterium]|jgi:3alpha(or 20beta)-hydroxysteroid dehydrogenase|nr:3-alpha-hydroxysteroid dehydrogenase [Actinomycetota bacterium]HAN08421.1 3-alpha-hydroxysteroid dehydrogenase [Acidimicrobiaceae bacterium]